jgi:large subunit ribosomal protein L1
MPIGKLSFTDDQLMQNLAASVDAIVRAKPTGAKGQYIKSVVICSTMSPSVRLDVQAAQALKVS